MKKVFFVFVLLIVAVFCLAEATEITFWYALSGSKGEVFKDLVEEFNDSQDEVYVKAIFSGKYAETAQKLTAAIAADILPNGGVVPAGPIFTGARDNYLILDYIENDPELDMDDFYQAMWDYSKYDGKICAIPYNISTPVMYYNKELFEEAGLDPNSPPQTWEELLEYASKITKDENGDGIPEIWGVDMKDTPWIFKAFLSQNECEIIDESAMDPKFDTPEGYEAAEFWQKLIDEEAMPVGLHDIAEKMFLGGTLGIYLGTSSRIGTWPGNTEFEFGVDYLPAGKIRSIPIGGAVIVLFPYSEEENDATYKFIKWLVEPENVAYFSMNTGYIPIRESALEVPELVEFMEENPMYEVAFEQLKYGFSYWHFNEMGTMDDLIWEALEKIEREIATPEEAMDWVSSELEYEIEVNK
jgi:sn-glycerol 3-phosphate transport system substrate-binding protein